MSKWKKKLGLENLTRREKVEKTVATVVCAAAVTAWGTWVLTGESNINASERLANLGSIVGIEDVAAANTQYVPKELDGVCDVIYEGELDGLFVQGNDEGYRWTAVLSPEEFTFEGFYVDEFGVEQPCDYTFYEEQFQQREPQHASNSQIRLVEEGEEFFTGLQWGEDINEPITSLHRYSGSAVRTPELTEGDSLGTGISFASITHNLKCEEDAELCIRWQAHIVATYDKEVILPPEERPMM